MTIQCWLPGGLYDQAGRRYRVAELAELSGSAELLLSDHATQDIAGLTTLLLSCVLRRVGELRVDDDGQAATTLVRNLSIADRLFLLVKLRAATVGDYIQATILCPQPACHAKIDIDFRTDDIPVKEAAADGPLYTVDLAARRVVFRLPNGADQEALAPILAVDAPHAATLLLQRCIQQLGASEEPPTAADIAQLSAAEQSAIEEAMAAVAPQVVLMMEGDCPECGQPFALPFDLAGHLLWELRTTADQIYREIHYLAYHYHWSERELLAMSKAKRRKYIQVLAAEIERSNHATR